MKYISQRFLVAMLVLFSTQSFSQVSLSTLQKLALLNSNNVYTLPVEIREILEPKGYRNIQRRWVKGNNVNGKEIITINATFEGNMISYELYNVPKSKTLVESIKKLGNFAFKDEDLDKTHFRNTDKKLYYDVFYTTNYSRCIISIFKYSEPLKKEKEKVDSVETKETTMVAVNIVKRAEYSTGYNDFVKFIKKNLKIPKDADAFMGKIYANFEVLENGNVGKISITSTADNEDGMPVSLHNEVVKVLKLTNGWKPALQDNGKPISTSCMLKIEIGVYRYNTNILLNTNP